MKVFKVWVDKYDYDTYDSFVCVANSEDEIRSASPERLEEIARQFGKR